MYVAKVHFMLSLKFSQKFTRTSPEIYQIYEIEYVKPLLILFFDEETEFSIKNALTLQDLVPTLPWMSIFGHFRPFSAIFVCFLHFFTKFVMIYCFSTWEIKIRAKKYEKIPSSYCTGSLIEHFGPLLDIFESKTRARCCFSASQFSEKGSFWDKSHKLSLFSTGSACPPPLGHPLGGYQRYQCSSPFFSHFRVTLWLFWGYFRFILKLL